MIYLYIDENRIKLLYLKKTMLGQYETVFFEKKHEAQLLNKGKVVSTDLLASAIKEAMSLTSQKPISDKEVFLVLQQEAFYFLRTEVPSDIAPSAVSPFIQDKARAVLPVDIDNCISDFFVRESSSQKILTFYALDRETVEQYQQALALIDLKISSILPDTLTYFKLFEKTLRKDKKENILYVFHDKDLLHGYAFDSYGLIDPVKWTAADPSIKLETALKEKAKELEEKKFKLNRLVLSGPLSENIRQDTFTKAVGVWTNPLKRIIPTFYQDYLKLLVVHGEKQFPILNLDAVFGAFIFHQENRDFSLVKHGLSFKKRSSSAFAFPTISLPIKEIVLFATSFVLSFIFFLAVSNLKLSFPSLSFLKWPSKVTKTPVVPTPTYAPTPAPSLKREDLKIKILNGSGTAGKAGQVKDILKNKGYQEILTGNADTFDFTQTVLQVKKSKSDATNMIQADLKDYVSSFKQTVLDEKEAADVVIIVGSDFK